MNFLKRWPKQLYELTVGEEPGEQTGPFAVVQDHYYTGLDTGGGWGSGANSRYVLETEGIKFANGLGNRAENGRGIQEERKSRRCRIGPVVSVIWPCP